MDCTVEYDALLHRWIRRWAKNPILDEQTLLHRSHGHAVLMLLTTWCLRAARFLRRLATRASSKAAMAVRHVERHCPRSSEALMSDCGCIPHLFKRNKHTHTHTHKERPQVSKTRCLYSLKA